MVVIVNLYYFVVMVWFATLPPMTAEEQTRFNRDYAYVNGPGTGRKDGIYDEFSGEGDGGG